MRRLLEILKWTLIDQKIFRWFFANTEDMKPDLHESIMIEENSPIEEKRWFFHGTID